jgi:murein DD-endopeptidase MepM/ murein hydrolase activator NlpD
MIIKSKIKSRKCWISFLLALLQAVILISCSAHAVKEPPKTIPEQKEETEMGELPRELSGSPGIFHIVQKGENLYRISKTYGIALSTLIVINDIQDPDKIHVGQPIFIPGATEQLPVHIPSPDEASKSAGGSFIWPVSGEISSHFGDKRSNHYHSGIDIRCPYGTPIHASRSGTVIFSGHQRGYGRTVIIDHRDGFSTLYAHNCKNLVNIGEHVSKGDTIASTGTSGNASGSHVHFEIRVRDMAVDPLPYLN